MLNSLYIRNYRCLKDFKINRLGRINLLTGKNNTGKSSILEAIAIYASNGDPKELFKILEEHNENFLVNSKSNKENNKPTSNIKQNFLNSLANLFSGRKIVFDDTFSIYIGQNRGIFDINNEISGKSVILGFSIFKEVFYPDNVIKKEKVNFDDIDNLSDRDKSNLILDFEINSTKEPTTFILDSDNIVNYFLQDSKIKENFQLVRSNNVEKKDNPKLFDNIALTDKEQYVIEALKIIEPNIERITFVDSDSSLDRIAVIKLAGSNNTIP
ncbi:MAG TPA: AAA family ATPase, partial [Candidatus Kapabacteria bacterium]|nr:AAA family ATPase [Candidatus Kapabacteria bacterium]